MEGGEKKKCDISDLGAHSLIIETHMDVVLPELVDFYDRPCGGMNDNKHDEDMCTCFLHDNKIHFNGYDKRQNLEPFARWLVECGLASLTLKDLKLYAEQYYQICRRNRKRKGTDETSDAKPEHKRKKWKRKYKAMKKELSDENRQLLEVISILRSLLGDLHYSSKDVAAKIEKECGLCGWCYKSLESESGCERCPWPNCGKCWVEDCQCPHPNEVGPEDTHDDDEGAKQQQQQRCPWPNCSRLSCKCPKGDIVTKSLEFCRDCLEMNWWCFKKGLCES